MAKKVLLGVTGCIAAYKIPELTRLFIKKGYQVKVILTDCAKKFVTETTMQTLSKNPVYTDIFEPKDGWFPSHIDLAQWADIFLIAPLSANVLAKISVGMADNLLLNVLLAYAGPVVFSPTMNDQMYNNPMVQRNLSLLQEIERYHVIAPEEGFLACLSNGPGRLPDPPEIIKVVESL